MADIRPNALPDAILPLRSGDAIIVDQGADGVRKTDPISMTDSVAPVATQSEAQAGTDNTKRMTSLRTKQSIASEVGVTIASSSQGAKADTAVQSVNGKSGNSVTIVKGDVGLGNVDNTSDADKPISNATQTALNGKANSAVTISAGTGLTGGGNLTANRTIALNPTSIASLAKADSSVQTVNGVAPTGGNVSVSAEEVRLQDSRASAILESFAGSVNFVQTAGYSIVGDGGAALYKRVSTEPTHAGKFQSADGAWWEIADRVLRPEMFGIKGDGSDETALLQGMFDFAAGKEVRFPNDNTYGITVLTLPAFTTLYMNGSKFRRNVAANSHPVVINSDTYIKDFYYDTPGALIDAGPRIGGSRVIIEGYTCLSEFKMGGQQSSSGYGLIISTNNPASQISDITVSRVKITDFSGGIKPWGVVNLNVYDTALRGCALGCFVQNVTHGRFINGTIVGADETSAIDPYASRGNGFLVEALSTVSTQDIVIDNWEIRGMGSHGIRLGGVYSIRNVKVIDCVVRDCGFWSVSTGGCGFKSLPNTSASQYHMDIQVIRLTCYDNNWVDNGNNEAVGMFMVSGGLVEGLRTYRVNRAYSSTYGIFMANCLNVRIVNPMIEWTLKSSIRLSNLQGEVWAGVPQYMRHIQFDGGLIFPPSDAVGVEMQPSEGVFTNIHFNGINIRGGLKSLRALSAASQYEDCTFDFVYTQPVTTDTTGPWTTVAGITLRGVSRWWGTPNGNNGDFIQDRTFGQIRQYKSGAWAVL